MAESTTLASRRDRDRSCTSSNRSLFLVALACLLSVLSNLLALPALDASITSTVNDEWWSRRPEAVSDKRPEKRPSTAQSPPSRTQPTPAIQEPPPPLPQPTPAPTLASSLATLTCSDSGDDSFAQEMVYWRNIPSDATVRSPYSSSSKNAQPHYLTFEYDGGGWNNMRMSIETVVALAVAMGRTLVLPPRHRVSNFGTAIEYHELFTLDLLEKETQTRVISMEDFLRQEGLSGRLRNKETGQVEFPPGNRTNWDRGEDAHQLFDWLRTVTLTPIWFPDVCYATFPAGGPNGTDDVFRRAMDKINNTTNVKPVAARHNGTLEERMREMHVKRQNLCTYDRTMQEAPVVHIMYSIDPYVRLLTHFYTFVLFEDWRADLWMKRFIRDHVRYNDAIQCAAARVVRAVRRRAREADPNGNPDGLFDSFHIRRGDFEKVYKFTQLSNTEIYNITQPYLRPNATLYIATDERNRTFFQPLRDHYTLIFLDDVVDEAGVDPHLYGLIEQLVAARGQTFFGTYVSTFTSYIMRIRGYHALQEHAPGSDEGMLPSTFFYTPKENLHLMHQFAPVKIHFFEREYSIAWRHIDDGIGQLPS